MLSVSVCDKYKRIDTVPYGTVPYVFCYSPDLRHWPSESLGESVFRLCICGIFYVIQNGDILAIVICECDKVVQPNHLRI